jgi:hypothetical protein
LSGEVRVVLPPRHLITVSESPGHYGGIYIKQSTKHPTFSFVPWKLSVPVIVWMRKVVTTVSFLYFIFEDGDIDR